MFRTIQTKLFRIRNAVDDIRIRFQSSDVSLFINGTAVTVPSYFSVLQALWQEKLTIPYFCFHERLSVAGNCRMCLVQIEGILKPQVACALPVAKGMKIRTNSPVTKMAQEAVLEFMLANHPLDCPICDQGGECDLQDLSERFGNDRSRFTDIHFDGKRAVENKDLSPLIRCVMNRCIHCTRCIRFANQVSGVEVLGTTGRGNDMLVGTYVDNQYFSEVSGNIIDLCPVGALTSIPYMFKGRPWELNTANSIDVTDATGTNIVVKYRFDRVLRVLPREHEEINQEWLSDKGRWAIDSLELQRLVTPMKKRIECCEPIEWDIALEEACKMIKCTKPEKILAIAGPHTNVETLVTCKDFLNILGCENTYIERDLPCLGSVGDIRAGYSLNISMNRVAEADKILLVGTNPRFEAAILNTWIREAYRSNEADIYVIGPKCDYNYHVTYLGDDVSSVQKAKSYLRNAKKPLILVGVEQLGMPYGGQILCAVTNLANSLCVSVKDWVVLHVLPLEASFAGALEAGWKPGAKDLLSEKGKVDLIISLGADKIFYDWEPPVGEKTRILYIGFQGDKGAEMSELILPGSAYTESGGLYLNMECRSQYALPAVTPPGKARHDWKIIRAIAEYCGVCLSYCDHNTLCVRMGQISPLFTYLGMFQPKLYSDLIGCVIKMKSEAYLKQSKMEVKMKKIADYYCSDVFTYNSPTMVKTKRAATAYEESPYYPI